MTKLKSLRAELTQARAHVKALREAIAVEKRLTAQAKADAKAAKAARAAEKRAAAILKAEARLQKLLEKQAAPVGVKAKKAARRPSKAVVATGAEAVAMAKKAKA
jgi:hypothetical protein